MEQIAAVITIKLYVDPLYSPTSNTQPRWDAHTNIYTAYTHILSCTHIVKLREKSLCVWRTLKIREKFRWKSVYSFFFSESPQAEWLQATHTLTHRHTLLYSECVSVRRTESDTSVESMGLWSLWLILERENESRGCSVSNELFNVDGCVWFDSVTRWRSDSLQQEALNAVTFHCSGQKIDPQFSSQWWGTKCSAEEDANKVVLS